MMLKGDTPFHKVWYFLTTYVLTLKRFDLFLQGSLLIVILLETNIYLLLKRDTSAGYNPGLVEDYVKVGAAGVEFVLGAAVAWFGRGRRQLSISSWLAITSASGLLVLIFPFAETNPANVELCGGQTITDLLIRTNGDDNVTGRTVFLVITAIMCTLTKISIWCHGLTYLDDHDPQNGPYYYGILISIRLSLGLSGNNWLRPTSVSEDWWEAQLSLCMLTFMFAFLFTLFPKRMPQCEEFVEAAEDTDDNGFCAALGRLVRNKALVIQTLGLAFLSAAVFGFVYYDRDYVQARFHVEAIRQDPRTSRALSDIFRSLVIIFFVMVLIRSDSQSNIFRVRFSARRSDGVKASTASRVAGVVAIFVAVFFIALSAIGCSIGDIEGLQTDGYGQLTCSQNCGCNSEQYGFSPVCALDTQTTYFSPCNAGCYQSEDLNGFVLFHNCSCGAVDTRRAVRGSCTLDSCRSAFSLYQVFYTIMLAVSGSCLMMQGMVVLRAVRPSDKAVAVGASFAVVALLSFVLGHLLYMIISHLTCTYSVDGACLLHSYTLWTACAASAVLSALTAIASLVASRASAEPTTEL